MGFSDQVLRRMATIKGKVIQKMDTYKAQAKVPGWKIVVLNFCVSKMFFSCKTFCTSALVQSSCCLLCNCCRYAQNIKKKNLIGGNQGSGSERNLASLGMAFFIFCIFYVSRHTKRESPFFEITSRHSSEFMKVSQKGMMKKNNRTACEPATSD